MRLVLGLIHLVIAFVFGHGHGPGGDPLSPLGIWKVGERVPTQGPDQREAVTTQGAVEAEDGASFPIPPERPWESPFRFDRIHDREGLSGHWPGDAL